MNSNQIDEALEVINKWSKTFGLPISMLPTGIKEMTASLYLCLRAIDEIEDSEVLTPSEKVFLLKEISRRIQYSEGLIENIDLQPLFEDYKTKLPDVTLNLKKWLLLPSPEISFRIWELTATMSERMSHWVGKNWKIDSERDLIEYSYAVGGSVAITLADLWAWFDDTKIDRRNAISYGIFLQCVNILRGIEDDKSRGVSYLPPNWTKEDLILLSKRHLDRAKQFSAPIKTKQLKDAAELVISMSIEALYKIESGEMIELDGLKKP